ncbi:MAG: hypothetical protein Kow0062_13490 [Acidobacteriota bacterium]
MTQDPLADLTAQAEQAFASGDPQAARQIWEAMLQIDPEHPAARQGLARLGAGEVGPTPAPTVDPGPVPPAHDAEPSQGLDLELDLDLIGQPSAAAPPATPSSPPPGTPREGASVRELLEAAEEIDPVSPVQGIERSAEGDGGSAVPPEVLEMVAAARDALADGNTAEATRLASRALALDEKAPGADEIIAQARSLEQLQADRAEYQLRDGIHAFEQGQFEEARARFEAVLAAVPEHAEAREYLERLEAARLQHAAAPAGETPGLHAPDLDAIDAIPLGVSQEHDHGVAAQATGPAEEVTTLPPTPDAVDQVITAPPEEVVTTPPADCSSPPASSVDTSQPAPTGPEGGIAVPPPPPGPGAIGAVPAGAMQATGAPAPPASWGAPRAGTARAGGARRGFVLGLALVGLLVAGWYAARTLGLIDSERLGETIARSITSEVRKATAALPTVDKPAPEGKPAAGTPQGDAQAVAPSADAGARSGVAREEPVYTRGDVPRLVARARAALRDGDPAVAVELLTAAQHADPTNFDVLEQLELARDRLRERQEAEQRLQAGRDAFARGNYEEALRLFYRVPQDYRPPHLDRWIATGWYNLGVLALQARSAGEAQRFFNDCLELTPDDEEARRHREVARRYRRRAFDDAYGLYVSNLKPRPLPD